MIVNSRNFRRWDLANIVALALLSAALRAAFVGVPVFDPDEGEFIATAAYLHANHQSAFCWPTHPYAIAAFKLAADVFGPFHVLPLRFAAILLHAAVAGLIYLWLARSTSRWCGVLTAAFVEIFSLEFNGHTVNRELPCVFLLILGGYAFVLSCDAPVSRQRWLCFASGLATGLALFFKEQAAYITQAIPIWLVLQAACERRAQPWLRKGLLYAAGGLTAGAIYLLPFLFHSTLAGHLHGVLEYGAVWGFHGTPASWNARSTRLIDQFFLRRPARLFLLMAYLSCCLELIGLSRRLIRGSPAERIVGISGLHCRRSGLLVACYVITSAAAVAMGNRFASGYFLLWLPFVFLAGGHGLYLLVGHTSRSLENSWATFAAAAGLYVLVAVCFHPSAASLLALTYVATLWKADKVQPVWRPAAWLPYVTVTIVVSALACEFRPAYEASRYAALAQSQNNPALDARAFFAANAQPGDRLFAWGSLPQVYCITGLEPASCFTTCGFADGRFFATDGISERWSRELFQELRERRPRFVVVGPTGSTALDGNVLFGLERFPALADFLRDGFRKAASLSDCEIFVRRPAETTASCRASEAKPKQPRTSCDARILAPDLVGAQLN